MSMFEWFITTKTRTIYKTLVIFRANVKRLACNWKSGKLLIRCRPYESVNAPIVQSEQGKKTPAVQLSFSFFMMLEYKSTCICATAGHEYLQAVFRAASLVNRIPFFKPACTRIASAISSIAPTLSTFAQDPSR